MPCGDWLLRTFEMCSVLLSLWATFICTPMAIAYEFECKQTLGVGEVQWTLPQTSRTEIVLAVLGNCDLKEMHLLHVLYLLMLLPDFCFSAQGRKGLVAGKCTLDWGLCDDPSVVHFLLNDKAGDNHLHWEFFSCLGNPIHLKNAMGRKRNEGKVDLTHRL